MQTQRVDIADSQDVCLLFEQFLIECRKGSRIAFILLHHALGLV